MRVSRLSKGLLGGAAVRNLPANAGDSRDAGSVPGSGGSPGVGNGNPPQYSRLENPGGAWQATVHGGHRESGHDQEHTHIHRLL